GRTREVLRRGSPGAALLRQAPLRLRVADDGEGVAREYPGELAARHRGGRADCRPRAELRRRIPRRAARADAAQREREAAFETGVSSQRVPPRSSRTAAEAAARRHRPRSLSPSGGDDV